MDEHVLIEGDLGFRSISERMDRLDNRHQVKIEGRLEFGINFLDRMFQGIQRTDLILIGAPSGIGKTELSNQIADYNASKGKRVHFFALEAEDDEVEMRMLYRKAASLSKASGSKKLISYVDWYNRTKTFAAKVESQARDELAQVTTLHTFYRTKSFGARDFKKVFAALNGKSDLVIIDHLHYFDLDDNNENKEITEVVKAIRDLVLINQVPVILIAHMRKADGKEQKLIGTLDDFHGSSNVFKIPTKSIILASGGITLDNKPLTLIRLAKFRLAGERTRYIGRVVFDTSVNRYEQTFELGVLSGDGKVFEKLEELPWWLKKEEE